MKSSLVLLVLSPLGLLQAATTMHPVNADAYGANIGWINTRGDVTNGVVVGEFSCSGWMWSANVGWISLGSGSPANGYRYQNNSAADFGVNVQDYTSTGSTVQARLRGYAYGANIGWIAFEASGDPRVDLISGRLEGYAYSANAGWIVLHGSGVVVKTFSIATGPDSDGDGIPDPWEFFRTGNLTLLTALTDSDGDGASDRLEYFADTNPLSAADALRITSFTAPRQIAPGGPFTTDLAWTSKPTRFYDIEKDTDLSGAWAKPLSGVIPGPGATSSRTLSETAPPEPKSFYRVRAKLPLVP